MKRATHLRSEDALAYRGWYDLKIWEHKPSGLRWQCLVKAKFTCVRCGFRPKPSQTRLLHADHIVPHKGDWLLFKDQSNLQCLCETCSNSAKQAEEKRGFSVETDATGWPSDPRHPANKTR